jgi:hypothetical protein
VAWVVGFGVLLPLGLYRNVKGLWVGILTAGSELFDRPA